MDVLFTGTPCQTAALRRYLAGVDTSRLLVCDMVCMGVPSPLMLKEYFAYIERKTHRKVVGHACRSKANGWGGHLESIRFDDGREDNLSFLSQIYGKLFSSRMILRPSCTNCKYTNICRAGDITMGDFWGIEKRLPEFYDKRGISLVLVNSAAGKAAFDEMKDELEYISATEEDAISGQLHLQQPVKAHPDRTLFWNAYYENGFESAIKKYAGCSGKAHLKHNIKKFPPLMRIYRFLKKS